MSDKSKNDGAMPPPIEAIAKGEGRASAPAPQEHGPARVVMDEEDALARALAERDKARAARDHARADCYEARRVATQLASVLGEANRWLPKLMPALAPSTYNALLERVQDALALVPEGWGQP